MLQNSSSSKAVTFTAMMAMEVRRTSASSVVTSTHEHDSFFDVENICSAKVLNFDSPNSSFRTTDEEPMDVDNIVPVDVEPMDVDVMDGLLIASKSFASQPPPPGKKRRFIQTTLSPAMFSMEKKIILRKHLAIVDLNTSSTSDASPSTAFTLPKKISPTYTGPHGKDQRMPVVIRKRNLIGDASKKLILPTIRGRHHDLRSISAETLSQVMMKKAPYDGIDSVSIVDCRYPYEFQAGHVCDAVNIHTVNELIAHFLINHSLDRNKCAEGERNIVIFHCEFSSQRGPSLARHLRNEDRKLHKEQYPYLKWPEIYLLEGGYKKFFESYKELCDPPFYKPMIANGHEEELRHYRKKMKQDPVSSSSAKNITALTPFRLVQLI